MSTSVIRVRRRWFFYVSDAIVVLLFFGRGYRGADEWDVIDIVNIVTALIFLANFILNCFRRSYLVADATHLTIHHHLFITTKISIAEIQRIELQVLSNSIIHLIDGTQIHFNYFQVKDSDFDQLKAHLQVPVE